MKFDKRYLYDMQRSKDLNGNVNATGKISYSFMPKEDIIMVLRNSLPQIEKFKDKLNYESINKNSKTMLKLLARILKLDNDRCYIKMVKGLLDEYCSEISYSNKSDNLSFSNYVLFNDEDMKYVATYKKEVPNCLINALENMCQTLASKEKKQNTAVIDEDLSR